MTKITTRKVFGVEGLGEDFDSEADAAAAAIEILVRGSDARTIRDAIRKNSKEIMDHLRILTEPRNVKA